jgi:hypothetical protein
LTRQSINFLKGLFAKKMDARVKPAHDESRITAVRLTWLDRVPDALQAHLLPASRQRKERRCARAWQPRVLALASLSASSYDPTAL